MCAFHRFGQILFFTSLLYCVRDLDAQYIIVNSNGDRIVMYSEGSWRAMEPGDSLLLRRNLQKSEAIGFEHETIDPSNPLNKGEHEECVLRQWN